MLLLKESLSALRSIYLMVESKIGILMQILSEDYSYSRLLQVTTGFMENTNRD